MRVLFRGRVCRVIGYHGAGRFMLLGPGDRRYLAHREHLTFLRAL